jgi:protein-S-isoprenylcysteine O-methyltransferase Ste14
MTSNSTSHASGKNITRGIVNRFLQLLFLVLLQALILFGTAGGLRYPEGWAYLVQYVGFSSMWAYLPALGLCMTIVARTALEDRTLQRELEGYLGYAQRVRYRLVPGVW